MLPSIPLYKDTLIYLNCPLLMDIAVIYLMLQIIFQWTPFNIYPDVILHMYLQGNQG